MGYGYTYTCDCNKKRFLWFLRKKNQYTNKKKYNDDDFEIYLGLGMDMNIHSMQYYRNAVAGQYGKEWQELVKKHPEGKFQYRREVYKCFQCGFWDTYDRKTFCEVNNGNLYERRALAMGMAGSKTIIGELPQICPKCNHLMKVVNIQEESLICGRCHKRIKIDFKNVIDWD